MAKKQIAISRPSVRSTKTDKSGLAARATRRKLPARPKLIAGGLIVAGLFVIGLSAYSVWQNYSANAANWGNKVKICNSKYSNSPIKAEAYPHPHYRIKEKKLLNKGKEAKRCMTVDVGTHHHPVIFFTGPIEGVKIKYGKRPYTWCYDKHISRYGQLDVPTTEKVVTYRTYKKDGCKN